MSLNFVKTILVSTQVLPKSAKNVAEGTSYRFDAIDPCTLSHQRKITLQ